ncbi:hypothetical protein MIR68_009533 [Amoeboaphelidium protococcarum]|nr:hypothetical protein MIR68_009533 [Amoeboaphelidium protococcarum]
MRVNTPNISPMLVLGIPYLSELAVADYYQQHQQAGKSRSLEVFPIKPKNHSERYKVPSTLQMLDNSTSIIVERKLKAQGLDFLPQSRSIAHYMLQRQKPQRLMLPSADRSQQSLQQIVQMLEAKTISVAPDELQQYIAIVERWKLGERTYKLHLPAQDVFNAISSCADSHILITVPRAISLILERLLLAKGQFQIERRSSQTK